MGLQVVIFIIFNSRDRPIKGSVEEEDARVLVVVDITS